MAERRFKTAAERLRHLTDVARLYCQGMFQHEIAQETGVSRSQIQYDLDVIRRQWRDSAIRDFDAVKAEQLGKIDRLERTYWAAWERSCGDAKVDTTKAKKDEKNGQTVEKATRVEGQVGDASYLQGVERCIKLRSQILGLNAPIKSELTGKDGAPIGGVSVDDVMKALMSMHEHGAGEAGADSGDPPVC